MAAIAGATAAAMHRDKPKNDLQSSTSALDRKEPSVSMAADAQAIAQANLKKPPIIFKKNPRAYIYATLDDPNFSTVAKIWSIFMMILILVSTICFVLESETVESDAGEKGILAKSESVQDASKAVFGVVEWFSVCVFTLEYCGRLFCVDVTELKRFLLSFQNTVDLVAWLPFWIILGVASGGSVSGLGFVRAIRLVRVFRVFKVGRYSTGIQMFTGALRNSTQALLILVGGVIISTVIVSSMMYLVEDDNFDCFGTIPNSCWWAITTITTVGYGDCYPTSLLGKLVATATMVMGVIIIALPITVVGSNFAKMCEMYEEETLAFAMKELDEGEGVDELQLREYLSFQKREGALRRDVDLRITFLMEKFDPDENGKVSREQFALLKEYCIRSDTGDAMAELESVKKQCKSTAQTVDVLQAQFTSFEASQAERLEKLEGMLKAIAERLHSSPALPAAAPLPAGDESRT